MAALQELIPASFRGVPFLVPHGTVDSGRHAVKHEYPDSNTRYVEDNGLRVPDIKLKAVVHGANVLSRVRRLEAALQAVGPGTLVHPLSGRKFVNVDTYQLTHTDESVGVYEFDIVFLVTGPPVFPGPLSAIAASITGLSSSALMGLFANFQSALALPTILTGATLGAITSALNMVASVAVNAFGSVAAVRVFAATLARAPNMFTSDAKFMAASLQSLFRAPFEDTSVPAADLWRGSADFIVSGTSILAAASSIDGNTIDRTARRSVLEVIGTSVIVSGFIGLCEASASKTYSTAEQVSDDIRELVSVHAEISELSIMTDDRNRLAQLLSETVAVLQKQSVVLPSIASIVVNSLPASVMAYWLYDDDKSLQTIVGLNDGQSPILYEGAVNVLRQS